MKGLLSLLAERKQNNDLSLFAAGVGGFVGWGGISKVMLQPSLDDLLNKVDSRYTLVVAAAKRARQLMDGSKKLVDSRSDKPVTIALEEIQAGKIKYERTKMGIK